MSDEYYACRYYSLHPVDFSFPEPTTHNGQDNRPMPSATEAQDERRERDWAYLEAEAREFALKYGAPAMLRCIANALHDQQEMFRK